MRGRTLDNAFAILDEAQNTTQAQMKMFLTRLGFGSKMIVNGDVTQIDLPHNAKSGLLQAEQLLKGISHMPSRNFPHRMLCATQLSPRLLKLMANMIYSCKSKRRSKQWI